MSHVNNFRDLDVYKLSRELSKDVFELTKAFPKTETYSLTDQIRRSSRSIGAQIAEAWGKRKYAKHFVSKLTDADAEQMETQHWIETAQECEYITDESGRVLNDKCLSLGRMLNTMMDKASTFCGKVEVRNR